MDTIISRVSFLENLAIAQKRDEMDREKRTQHNEYVAALYAKNVWHLTV
jgi:hypothetical protein